MNSEVVRDCERTDEVKSIITDDNANKSQQENSRDLSEDASAKRKVRLLILVGFPGSGKSTLARNICKIYPNDWCRVNQDDLGSRRACEDLARVKLGEGKSVIVDRVNFDKSQRKTWVEIAWKFDVPVDAIIMDTPMEECSSRIISRTNHPTDVQGQKGVEILEKFQEWMKSPEHIEGIESIICVKPQPTGDSYDKRVIDEILFRLDNETMVKHDRSVNVNELSVHAGGSRNHNSRERYSNRGGPTRRGGHNYEPRAQAHSHPNANVWSGDGRRNNNNGWALRGNRNHPPRGRSNSMTYQNDFPPLGNA
ncbi:1162_t:CDS:2 [Acaulospora colombiana]|uniref:1162_t:CDS:1 n=1 Tax=Acaulospora colombiana TaxID=27376 RepID=A0ACA9N1I7_9GLOM|nr:1162_t:CDS:2 [Acaulospora colombiana]